MRSRSPMKFRTYGPEFILDALEERIVLDASVATTSQDHHDNAADNHTVQTQTVAVDSGGHNTDAGQADAAANPGQSSVAQASQVFNQDLKVVLISNALDHVDTIAQAVKDNAKVMVVDANKDTLTTIEHNLENLVQTTGQKIGTLTIVGHGKDGAVEIGADNIQLANLFKYESGLKSLSTVLAEGAQIQFYGCSVASDAAGQTLLGKIADDTHATVFASTNTTGGAGNDWNLEFSTTPGTPMYVLLDTAKLGSINDVLSFRGTWPLSDPNQYHTYWGSVDASDPLGIDGRAAEFWKFYGTAGEYVSIGMQTTRPDLGYDNAANIDTFLEIWNPDGTQAAQIDDWKSPPGTGNDSPYSLYSDSLLQWSLPQTGWYVVQACSWNLNDFADYSLISTKDLTAVSGNNINNHVTWRPVPNVSVDNNFTSYTYDMADFFGKPPGTTPDFSYSLGTLGGTLGAGTYACGIDTATGLITVTHTGTGSGTLTIPVTASDGATSGSWTFTLNVAAGNAAPYIENGGLPNIDVWPGDSLSKTIDLKTYFHDWEDGDNLTYNNPTPTVTDPNGVLSGWSVDNLNKTLTLNYSSTAQGTATINVTGKDSGGLTVAEQFTVTAKLNEPALQNIGFESGNTTGWTTDAGPVNVINTIAGSDGFATKMVRVDQNNNGNAYPAQLHQDFEWNGEKIQVGYDFFTYDGLGYDHFGYTITLNGTPIAYLNRDAGWSGHLTGGTAQATTGWITDPVVDPAVFGAHTGDVIGITLFAGNDVTSANNDSWAYFDLQLVTAQQNPVSKGIADIEAIEDSTDSVLNLFHAFYDAQTLPANMTYQYTITSTDNTSLFAHVDGAAPPDNTPVTIVNPSAFDLDYGPNQAGYANIKITATDADSHSVDYTFKVTVRPVNDLPTAGVDQSVVVETGQSQDITFTGNDPELFAATKVKFVTDYTGTGTLVAQGALTSLGGGDYSQVWRYTPNANYYGTETFQYSPSTPTGTWKGFETGQGTAITKLNTARDGTNDMQLADLNHDGYLDLVEVNQRDNGGDRPNYFYLNDRTGHFGAATPWGDDGNNAGRLVLADVNGDTFVDAVVINNGTNEPDRVYTWNSGTNTFNTTSTTFFAGSTSYGMTAVAVGDFNGDGWQDIAVGTDANPGTVIIFLNNGLGGFGTGKALASGSGRIGALGVGDFNSDGHVDIVVGKDSTADDLIFLNNGSGSFLNALHLPSTGRGNTTYLAVGDVDGDHSVDVVMGDNGLNRFYKNNGNGSFSYFPIGSETDNTTSIRLADLNKDGHLDVVAFNDFNGTTPQADKYYLFNTGTTNPYAANGTVIESAAIGDRAGVLGDVNKDGDVDLIMGIYTTNNNPNVGGTVNDRVFLNQGFNDSTVAQSPDPAAINVQTELIKNSGFETGDLGVNAWHVDERTTQDDPNVLALVGIVTSNTTIDMTTNAGGPVTIMDLVNNDYPPQLWAWAGASPTNPNPSITVYDPIGDTGDHILVSLDNGPRKDMIYQDVVIPNDPSVTQYTVTWKMAYWNMDFLNNNPQFHTAAERQPQYISLYVYDPTKTMPNPVWTTIPGTSPAVVSQLQDYSVTITDPALRGTKVRIGLEVFSGDNFLQVAMDDFHINPTRTTASSPSAGVSPAADPPYSGQPTYLVPPPNMSMASAASADTSLTMTLDSLSSTSGPTIVPILDGHSATGSVSLISVIEQQAVQTTTALDATQGTSSADQTQPASVNPTSAVDTGSTAASQLTVVVADTTQQTTTQTAPATQQTAPDAVIPTPDQTPPPAPPVDVILAGGFGPDLTLAASMVFDPDDLSPMQVVELGPETDSVNPATAELQHLAVKLAGGQSGSVVDLDAVRFTEIFA